MIVRAASPGDRPAILALVARAFDGGEEEVALVERIWAFPATSRPWTSSRRRTASSSATSC